MWNVATFARVTLLCLMPWNYKSSHRRCYIKKVFLKISKNSQENICVGVCLLLKLQAYFEKNIASDCFWNYNNNVNDIPKIPVICVTQLAGGVFLHALKDFEVYVKHFWIVRNSAILHGLWKYVFMNRPIIFFDRDFKTKSVPVSFFPFMFKNFMKKKFGLQSITVLLALYVCIV